jgi:hypothetical protein
MLVVKRKAWLPNDLQIFVLNPLEGAQATFQRLPRNSYMAFDRVSQLSCCWVVAAAQLYTAGSFA